ncbi:MAG: bifunctional metallophosphatase/5'-nucleotidase [Bacteroidota bacterium]
MYRYFCLLLTSLAFGACLVPTPLVNQPQDPNVSFSILHINDVYEIAPLEKGKVGGMARVATLERKLHSQQPNLYTVLVGDFLSPSVIGTVKLEGEEERVQGQQMVDLMNIVGVDWVVFGNHEFDIKEDALQKRLDESDFGWIGGNVRHRRNDSLLRFQQRGKDLPDYTIWEFDNGAQSSIRVGVIGVCLDANQQDFVSYENVFTNAKQNYRLIKDSVDFCIAMTHLSIEEDRELARQLPDLKLIMGGHEHERHFEKVGSVSIAKADANAKSAWIHRFEWNGESVQLISYLEEIGENIAPDPWVASQVKAWEQKAYQAFEATGLDLNAPVCKLETPLDGRETTIRTRPTNLGLALAESMYQAAEDADCAIVNSGSVRIDDFLRGEITEFDLVRTLPFGGAVLKVDMRGSLLIQILEAGMANQGNGGYLQTHLLSQENDQWLIGEQEIMAEEKYRVAISDFLLTGRESGLGFLTPQNDSIIALTRPGTESRLRDIRLVLADYLKKQ